MLTPQTEDNFLLFFELPYEFDEELPLRITDGLYLSDLHIDIISRSDPVLVCKALPGYIGGRGIAFPQSCLYAPDSETAHLTIYPNELFFDCILALRLLKPLGIGIASRCKIDRELEINEVNPYNLETAWNPSKDYYSAEDFRKAGRLLQVINSILKGDINRLRTGLMFFHHVTCGFIRSYQAAYLTLFSALESIFAPDGNRKAKTLSSRVAGYLKNYILNSDLEKWLMDKYISSEYGRHGLSHGTYIISPDEQTAAMRQDDFGYLHEITRLCLLGILSMNEDRLNNFKKSGRPLQNSLNKLEPAEGEWLNGQTIWKKKDKSEHR